MQGLIVQARGPAHFGWDPIFQPEGYSLTYAEMSPAVKNSISHRYKAINALQCFLQKKEFEQDQAADQVHNSPVKETWTTCLFCI